MTTLFDATLALAKILTTVTESTATGGSSTTLVDSARTEPDDHFNDGTLWFKSGNNINVSTKVSDFVNSTGAFTHATLLANAAGDTYAAADKDYPRDLLIQALNVALESLADLPQVNTATVTVANQESYSLPSGVRNILRVRVAQDTSSPYDYQVHRNWYELNGSLYFDEGHEPISAGYIIELTYKVAHATLSADSDTINAGIPLTRLKWEAAVKHAIPWRIRRTGRDNPAAADALMMAQQELQRVRDEHPIESDILVKDPHLASW